MGGCSRIYVGTSANPFWGAQASAPGADHAVEIDMQEMIEQPIDTDLFTEARRQFNVGNFRDHNSKVCMFRLLKAFIRELSAPLVPRTLYDMAIAFARTHMRETVAKVQASSAYPLLIEGFSEKAEDHALLTAWLARHWEDGNERLPPEHLAEECFKLVTITESIAFSVGHPMAELAELFFKLPKVRCYLARALWIAFFPLPIAYRNRRVYWVRVCEPMCQWICLDTTLPPTLTVHFQANYPHAPLPSHRPIGPFWSTSRSALSSWIS